MIEVCTFITEFCCIRQNKKSVGKSLWNICANIKEVTLLEALKQPLFMAYRDNQPFNNNHLRPCPMLENPEYLRNMVKKCNAKSTDLQSLEEVDHLCDKCTLYAHNWADVADKLWEENKKDK